MKRTEQEWWLDNLVFDRTHAHDNASNITKDHKVMDTQPIGIGSLAHTINLTAHSAKSIRDAGNINLRTQKVVWESTLAANVLKNEPNILLLHKQHTCYKTPQQDENHPMICLTGPMRSPKWVYTKKWDCMFQTYASVYNAWCKSKRSTEKTDMIFKTLFM